MTGAPRTVVLATGESRPVTRTFPDGAWDCPWCGGLVPTGVTACPNPGCLTRCTAEQVHARQATRSDHHAVARLRRLGLDATYHRSGS